MPSAAIAVNTSGDNTIVTGVAGYAIRVTGYLVSFSSNAQNVKWKSGASTDLTGLLYGPLAAGAPQTVAAPVASMQTRGWFQAAAGANLVLNLSASQAVGGHVQYELIPQ